MSTRGPASDHLWPLLSKQGICGEPIWSHRLRLARSCVRSCAVSEDFDIRYSETKRRKAGKKSLASGSTVVLYYSTRSKSRCKRRRYSRYWLCKLISEMCIEQVRWVCIVRSVDFSQSPPFSTIPLHGHQKIQLRMIHIIYGVIEPKTSAAWWLCVGLCNPLYPTVALGIFEPRIQPRLSASVGWPTGRVTCVPKPSLKLVGDHYESLLFNHFYYLIVGCTFQAFHYYPKWNYHSQWWGMPGIRGQGGIPTNSWALL